MRAVFDIESDWHWADFAHIEHRTLAWMLEQYPLQQEPDVPTPRTKLEIVLKNRDRYITFHKRHQPMGAPTDQWLLWQKWVEARRHAFHEAIAQAREEKRHNQREKANERKRDRQVSCRGK